MHGLISSVTNSTYKDHSMPTCSVISIVFGRYINNVIAQHVTGNCCIGILASLCCLEWCGSFTEDRLQCIIAHLI